MKTIAIIQARCGSSRLPNKILKLIQDKTILELILERISRAKFISQIIVATTESIQDDIIVEICNNLGYSCYRGSTEDLLSRHYNAVKELDADEIIKIPSDCPLIDPSIIDKVITYYQQNKDNFDFVSNLHPQSYPDGNDVEIMPFKILEYAYLNSNKKFEREHTTPYIWDNPKNSKLVM